MCFYRIYGSEVTPDSTLALTKLCGHVSTKEGTTNCSHQQEAEMIQLLTSA